MMNNVFISGVVGSDPQIVYNPNNTIIANLSIAVSESWKNKDGEWQERTDWINLACFGELAKSVENKIKKGTKLVIWGKLANDNWTDKDNKKHSKTYVHVKEFQILTSGTNSST